MTGKQIFKELFNILAVTASLYVLASLADWALGHWAGWVVIGAWVVYGLYHFVREVIRIRRSDAE